MSGVPSAFILVLVVVWLTPEGVLTECVRVVLVLVRPIGACPVVEVVDFDTTAPGLVLIRLVVIFDELVRIDEVCCVVVAVPVLAGAVVWARAAEVPSRLSETRKPRRRFIKTGFWKVIWLPQPGKQAQGKVFKMKAY